MTTRQKTQLGAITAAKTVSARLRRLVRASGLPPLILSSRGMHASDEIQEAVTALRTTTAPGAMHLADLLEENARRARIIESAWELAGYQAEECTEFAENRWRLELAVARALRTWPRSDRLT